MQYGHLTYIEIKEMALAGAIAIIPTGCTEQQGPHLPVDFDTWLAETLCVAAAGQAYLCCGYQFIVLPALPFGPTPEHRGFGSGYIHLEQNIHEAILLSILTSLAEQGFKKLIVWRGCGQHDLADTIQQFNRLHAGEVKAFSPQWIFPDILREIGDAEEKGGHADGFATSIALFLRPESVRTHKIYDPNNREVDWKEMNIDLSQYSPSGVIGDPTRASAAIGARLWKKITARMTKILCDCALSPIQEQGDLL